MQLTLWLLFHVYFWLWFLISSQTLCMIQLFLIIVLSSHFDYVDNSLYIYITLALNKMSLSLINARWYAILKLFFLYDCKAISCELLFDNDNQIKTFFHMIIFVMFLFYKYKSLKILELCYIYSWIMLCI